MKKKVFLAIVIVVVLIVVLVGIKGLQIKAMIASGKNMKMPPAAVTSVAVRGEKWQDSFSAIGSVTAVQGVTLTPEIDGTVSEIAFDSGSLVEKGALLVKLDTSSEDAQLRALEAQVTLARINAERSRTLRTNNTISQADLDLAEATLQQNQGNADAVRALIAKKTIRAPFAGQVGIRQVNLGEYLQKGQNIVSLQALAPVYGNFSLPQQTLSALTNGMHVKITSDTYPGKLFEGTLTAMNPELDANTRSVKLQATVANADQLLRPGMFVRMELLLPGLQDVLIVPTTSILSAPYGDSVYVVETSTNAGAGLVVRQQFVRTGPVRGDFISIENGLKVGQKVVGAGMFKLRNGMPVIENNEQSPKASETPHPSDT